MQQSHTQNLDPHSENLFQGIHPDSPAMPTHIVERLKDAFKIAKQIFDNEVASGNTPNWCVYTQHKTEWRPRHYEWAEYQSDHDFFNAPICFERYGYTEGLHAYTVSVVNLSTGQTDLNYALTIFSVLNEDPLLVQGSPDEVGHMASYSMIRREHEISRLP